MGWCRVAACRCFSREVAATSQGLAECSRAAEHTVLLPGGLEVSLQVLRGTGRGALAPLGGRSWVLRDGAERCCNTCTDAAPTCSDATPALWSLRVQKTT